MPKIDLTSQGYEIVVRQAQETKRSPDEEIDQQVKDNRLENSLAHHNAIMDEQGRITFQDLSTVYFLTSFR